MGIIKEFKEFAVKGNVIDMAVGIIIGTAFGRIVTSMVNDIVMPPIGYVLQGVDFTSLKYVIAEAEVNASGAVVREAVSINYGEFLQVVINFLLIGIIIFLFVKFINRLKRKAEDRKVADTPTPKDILLLSEIRDLLRDRAQK